MFTVKLECEGGHIWEGQYDLADDYYRGKEHKDIQCPVCDTRFVDRLYVPNNGQKRQLVSPFAGIMEMHSIRAHMMPETTRKALGTLLDDIRKHQIAKSEPEPLISEGTKHVDELRGEEE